MYIYAPGNKAIIKFSISTPEPLKLILKRFDLTGAEIGFIICNKEMLNLNHDLEILIHDHDVIELYPFIGGG